MLKNKKKVTTRRKRKDENKKEKTRKLKITDKFDIGGEEELNVALKFFFLLLNRNSGMNLYDFCLQLIEFVMSNKNHWHYLIYSPNSIHFLNIFQKVFITIDEWESRIPLESLLFLSEIIFKSMDSFNGYEIVVKNIITKIANYNVRLLKDELNSDKIKTRIWFALLRFYKDIEDSKIDAVDAIENAKALLAKLNQLDEQEGIPIEEIERQSIVLPWVSFEEWITKEALEVFSKDLDLEVNILHTRTKFDIIKKEIKIKEDKKERVPSELLDKMLTFGLFFFTSIFAMFDNDTNPQKDKNLLLECLRCGRKAMSKTSFKGFFMMFRYFYIKQDLLRIKGQKINNTLFSALYERAYLTNMMRDSFDRCKKLYNISNDFFIEGCLSQTIFDFVQNEENNKRIIKEINEGIFGGNEWTENIFLSNIDEHIKEVVLIFKKMMCLMINFINPHNITYTWTLSTPESFCSVFGFLFRLQSWISIILWWYYTTQKADKIKALETFKDLFMLIP